MLQFIYTDTPAGAPDRYGNAVDTLSTPNGAVQDFPKAKAGFTAPSQALKDAVSKWIASRGNTTDPVVVMVHGYLYDTTTNTATDPSSPLMTVYGVPGGPIPYNVSWLPLVGERGNDGTKTGENAVAFCYKSESDHAEYSDAGWINSYQYAVFDQSPLAARALASILAAFGDHPVKLRILAHSLGTRTTSQAIGLLRGKFPKNLDRIVLLDGAEFCVDAAANFANCPFDVFSFANGIDRVLQLGGDQFCHPFRATGTPGARCIGRDGLGGNPRWLDLALDNGDLMTWLWSNNAPTKARFRIDPRHEDDNHSTAFLEHWSCYTNDGNRALIHALLSIDAMTVAAFNANKVPGGVDSFMYGHFNGQVVPPTPQTYAERFAMIGSDVQPNGGGG